MLTGGQVAAATGTAVPVLIGSGLAVGGFESRPVAFALFALAGLWLIAACLYVPLRSLYYRRTGFAPVQATHKVIGHHAILRLDLGTQPAVTDLYCQVHLPNSEYVGGQPHAMAKVPPGAMPRRLTTFTFPDSFAVAPIYHQMRVVGWYQTDWVVTQHGSQRTIVTDRFHIVGRSRREAIRATLRSLRPSRRGQAPQPPSQGSGDTG